MEASLDCHVSRIKRSLSGWVDANKAITQLRDECVELGVSFITGRAGTATGFRTDSQGVTQAVATLAGVPVTGDKFVLAAGAWAARLASFYNSTLSTAQIVGYMRLTPEEMRRLETLPIYINFSTDWFNFPPHGETQLLKMAVHGWGYTRRPDKDDPVITADCLSSPPLQPARSTRPNFVPVDGESRLRQGLREILPELAGRPFERLALCWYTDTPSGDFIIDYHPDYKNLLVAGGGSGQYVLFESEKFQIS
ncbi:hypothetical protein A1O7_08412 [Cladophialophora yegresii CBS 114405]|uniref:FAD dependent oxidoreductase domain-containing protein n=1 Tax=Cladophialophora yegresii CBS 114405 TaxID=1182544 RepID=W9VR47_9EURO|nr:uncharacterized protein A1O7_08412 [Cladophialophora yegresii CBS 114405]EXJ55485.1 hypothetical protein A1O7_08412 [Cladophialophora yegresii CBS 114405]